MLSKTPLFAIILTLCVIVAGCERKQPELSPARIVEAETAKLVIEIVEYGTYRVLGDQIHSQAGGTAAGQTTVFEEKQLIAATTTLKAELGASFGYRFSVSGPYEGFIKGFEMRAIHPAIRGPDGRLSTTSTAPTEVFLEKGRSSDSILYTLHEDFEVVPGEWILQILHNSKVVASKSFILSP